MVVREPNVLEQYKIVLASKLTNRNFSTNICILRLQSLCTSSILVVRGTSDGYHVFGMVFSLYNHNFSSFYFQLLMEAELKLNTMKAFKAGQNEGQKIYQAGFRANNQEGNGNTGQSSQGFGDNEREFGHSNRGSDQSNNHGMMRGNNNQQRSFEPQSQRGNFGGPHPSANGNQNFNQGPQRNNFPSGVSSNRGRGWNRFNN